MMYYINMIQIKNTHVLKKYMHIGQLVSNVSFFFIVDVMNYYLNIQEPSPTLVLQISYGHFQQ